MGNLADSFIALLGIGAILLGCMFLLSRLFVPSSGGVTNQTADVK